MGEISDDLLEGHACAGCGMYFTEAHGYPVVCSDCWEEDEHGAQKAIHKLLGD